MGTFSQEQFEQLLATIKGMNATPPVVTVSSNGSFAKCLSRYDGKSNVEIFITDIDTYKESANVSEELAFKGFRMLLLGDVAEWWDGIKSTATDYSSAKELLRAAYGERRPKYKIFQEIFALKQTEDMSIDYYVTKVRALFSKLSVDEETQLDMVYGQLSLQLREKVKRTSFATYDKLLELARSEELYLDEVKAETKSRVKGENRPEHSRSVKSKNDCVYCRQTGHTRDECPKLLKKKDTPKSPPTDAPVIKSEIRCYGCGQPGVVRTKCLKCTPKPSAPVSSEFSALEFENLTLNPRARPLLPIQIFGKSGTGLLDTASCACIASVSLTDLLRSNNSAFVESVVTTKLADGSVQHGKRVLMTEVDVTIGTKIVKTKFVIFPDDNISNTILGIDFIQDVGIVIDNADQQWWIKDQTDSVQPLHFEKLSGEPLADIMTIELRSDEATLLSPTDRNRVSALLLDFSDIFEPGGEPTDFIDHHIDLVDPNQLPIAVPPYQLSAPKKAILRKEIDKMIDQDVIEECESPWAAPVVMVPKKNNEVRVCVDYRRLNAVTITDRYPLPRIDDLLHLAKQTLFMSSIDLRAGYWQVNLRETDRDKTAFITPFGLFRFKRMPFGLKNAPATFQRLIDRFRSGLPDVIVLAYLDDIIVISNDFDRHLDDLSKVFLRLQLYKLTANRSKCQFLRQNIKFLGHLITPQGIQADPDKVSAILDMKPPINVTQVRTFLQTCSWYRRFVDKFAETARPLTDLTKKNSPWSWGDSENDAFQRLKRLLTEAPILRQVDENLPFVIRTDASQYALGAVLLQGEKLEEKPIEYASRLLIAAERNYSTTEREALAVVWALNKFRGYVEGSEIIIGSDHQPLKWLLTLKTPIGRLARWVMLIQSFNLTISYTPGKINVVADTLSRPPGVEEPVVNINAFQVDFPQKGPESIRAEQLKDEELSKIIHSFETKDDPNLENYLNRGYLMEQGVLFRHSNDDSDESQLVVPSQMRDHILRQFHDDPTAGHYGADRTINKIISKYYWPGIRKFITDYCRKCVECQKYKAANHKPFGLIKTPVMSQRFEVLAVDLFGPLPESEDGFKHILILEDVCTRWVELFPLKTASAIDCTMILIDEVFLRFGFPRRLISDNGVQFISDVMQHTMFCLGIDQNLIPVYHPAANPVERRNRDLKTQLGILVGPYHREWVKYLPSIRFAMNTSKCESTGQTAAYLTFGRELRVLEDVSNDIRTIVQTENFVPQITPYLWKLQDAIKDAREVHETGQDRRKDIVNTRRQHRQFDVGDLVLVDSHVKSKAATGFTSKLAPKRDGPYRVCKVVNSNTYEIETADRDKVLVGKYNVSALAPYNGEEEDQPMNPIRRRGRPRHHEK